MANPFLANASLEKFIKDTKLSDQDKDFLLSKLPELDEEQRIKLFGLLKNIYFVDLEEKQSIENLKKYWKK